jgi:hypothetical protein
MDAVSLTSASGYTVGDRLLISAEAFDARVAGTTPRRVLVTWPWREVDPDSRNLWDGTLGFPRDPDAYDWCNTPWRLEPDPSELATYDPCFVGIPPTEVRITAIVRYDPPGDFGFLPRPDYALELCPVDLLDDEEAGFMHYLDGREPVVIEILESSGGA